ncbi:MAG: hypothetical protein LBB34_01100 [Holosporales bacterium]|jgi:hypothetical protein|nr:hypothetical protein [Holosporales bacterium]
MKSLKFSTLCFLCLSFVYAADFDPTEELPELHKVLSEASIRASKLRAKLVEFERLCSLDPLNASSSSREKKEEANGLRMEISDINDDLNSAGAKVETLMGSVNAFSGDKDAKNNTSKQKPIKKSDVHEEQLTTKEIAKKFDAFDARLKRIEKQLEGKNSTDNVDTGSAIEASSETDESQFGLNGKTETGVDNSGSSAIADVTQRGTTEKTDIDKVNDTGDIAITEVTQESITEENSKDVKNAEDAQKNIAENESISDVGKTDIEGEDTRESIAEAEKLVNEIEKQE